MSVRDELGEEVFGAVALRIREELVGRGVEVSEIDPQPWGTFVYYKDPDGNSWAMQQLVAAT